MIKKSLKTVPSIHLRNAAAPTCPHCGHNPTIGQIEEFIEAEDAAPFLKMSAEYLRKLARAGKIPAHPRGEGQRRRWLFLMTELAQWMKSQVNSACDPCSENS